MSPAREMSELCRSSPESHVFCKRGSVILLGDRRLHLFHLSPFFVHTASSRATCGRRLCLTAASETLTKLMSIASELDLAVEA